MYWNSSLYNVIEFKYRNPRNANCTRLGVCMSDVEIVGKPQYRSRKLQEEHEQNKATQKESKKRPTDPDLEYERDEKDWWWCDDV
jgi:hypothetical protein